MPKPSEKLRDRLDKELGLGIAESKLVFRRLYPGWGQRANGHWLWCFEADEQSTSRRDIGSIFRVSDLLKAKRLTSYRYSHVPNDLIEIFCEEVK